MKYSSPDSTFNTLAEAVTDTRKGKYPAGQNGVIPVIVRNQISARRWSVGVQYWTPAEIEQGTYINPDKSISILCELLNPEDVAEPTKPDYEPGQTVDVLFYNSQSKSSVWIRGKVIGVIPAMDIPYRVEVDMQFTQLTGHTAAHPDCVRPI